MKVLNKITCFVLLAVLPFSVIDAQNSTKKKSKLQTTAHKKNSSGKKKSSKKRTPSIANKKSEQNNAANPMGATLRLAEKQQSVDTSVPKTVTVTSVFKPSLKVAAKINFTAATPVIDSSRIPVTYQIPAQNLFFSYEPVAVKPLALQTDSIVAWRNDNFIKVGYGNYSSPHIEAGVTMGDNPANVTSLHGKYVASKGDLPYQEFYKANVEGIGHYAISDRLNLFSKLFYNHSTQYKYGTAPGISVAKENLLQQYNQYGLNMGVETKAIDSLGITYRPEFGVSNFSDNHGANEFTFLFNGNINKSFTNALSFDLGLHADLSNLKQPQAAAAYHQMSNNLYVLKPSVHFITPNVKLKLGFDPSWDNTQFALLPDITAEARLNESNVALEVGWQAFFNKNTYQSLTVNNPYIAQPGLLLNTKNIEQYVGVKGSISKQLSFNARFSLVKTNNLPLFANDTALNNRQTFITVYEPELKGFKIHGELNYTNRDKIFGGAAFNIINYANQQTYAKPWGILPFEITGYLKYKITKDFLVKGDVFMWDGAYYRNPADGSSNKLNPAADLSLGTEYTVAPRLNLWLQMNNVFNNKYQRWNQYEVLGFNVLGGIVYSFR